MRWEFDEIANEWDLDLDALPFEIRGNAVANVYRDEATHLWRATVLGRGVPGQWDRDELARARAEVVMGNKLEAALRDVRAGAGEKRARVRVGSAS